MPIPSCRFCLTEFLRNPPHLCFSHLSWAQFQMGTLFTCRGPYAAAIQNTFQPYFVVSLHILPSSSPASQSGQHLICLIRIRKNNQVSRPLLSLKLSMSLLSCLMLSLPNLFIYLCFLLLKYKLHEGREFAYFVYWLAVNVHNFSQTDNTYFSSISNTEHKFFQY